MPLPLIIPIDDGGVAHDVAITEDMELVPLDHPDLDAEYAAVAMGSEKPVCLALLETWSASPFNALMAVARLGAFPGGALARIAWEWVNGALQDFEDVLGEVDYVPFDRDGPETRVDAVGIARSLLSTTERWLGGGRPSAGTVMQVSNLLPKFLEATAKGGTRGFAPWTYASSFKEMANLLLNTTGPRFGETEVRYLEKTGRTISAAKSFLTGDVEASTDEERRQVAIALEILGEQES